jgi:hypothetical protein
MGGDMQLKSRALAALVALSLAVGVGLEAQRNNDDPEQVIRAVVVAMYSNDVATYNALSIPHPLRARLTAGGRVNQQNLDELKEYPEGLQIKAKRSLMFKGENAQADAKGEYPVGTTGLFMVAHGGSPMMVTLVRRDDGWKIDLRWWIAMTELASGHGPAPDSPEFAVRALLAAMLHLDRGAAARLSVPGADLNLLFDGAPRQREPSGVLDATVYEMPLVEIEPGEFARTPTGKVVEGTRAADRKVLVGQFGPVEIPFVVRRVSSGWRVEAEPYFAVMLQ